MIIQELRPLSLYGVLSIIWWITFHWRSLSSQFWYLRSLVEQKYEFLTQFWSFGKWSCNQVVVWLSSWKPLTLNLDPWKFGGRTFYGKDMFWICLVASRDHVRKGSSNLVTTLQILLDIGPVEEEMKHFYFITCDDN